MKLPPVKSGKNSKKAFRSACIVAVAAFVSAQLFSGLVPVSASAADLTSNSPRYVGIAKYYDNRACAVTVTLDDFSVNTTQWQQALSLLARKRIYNTISIITNYADWNYTQNWLDQGFTEAASHSRTHPMTPYDGFDGNTSRGGNPWQIDGSKQDITGNLTLPAFWRNGNRQYVYAWIEPYGRVDDAARQQMMLSGYIVDRTVTPNIHVYGLAPFDQDAGMFYQVAGTVEMGSPHLGGTTSALTLKSYFDEAYKRGGIYHLVSHPETTDWTADNYADEHTDYIANRNDVWYVPFGLLYLYDMVDACNFTRVQATSGQTGVFDVSIDHAKHDAFGVSYPITYVFDLPQNWTSGYAYLRFNESQPWRQMPRVSPDVFFNGIAASRFDFTQHKAYISVAFKSGNDHIYLQIAPQKISVANSFGDPTAFGRRYGGSIVSRNNQHMPPHRHGAGLLRHAPN